MTHDPLQQSVAAVQLPPVSLQVEDELARRHAEAVPPSPYALQVSPSQQVVPLQSAPKGVQDGVPPPHFRTPLPSGTHASLLQHWSLNWQAVPGWMQHSGFVPSQPVGQAAGQLSPAQPPKQRAMPLESALHTFFLPSQQFCEALNPARAPQMLPGGLQPVPLSQSCFVGLQVMPYVLSVEPPMRTPAVPPQQAAVESQ